MAIRYLSKWKLEYQCSSCEKPLSIWLVMYSNGVCPYCGQHNSSTVVDTTEHVYRYATYGKWWQLWIKKFRVYQEK